MSRCCLVTEAAASPWRRVFDAGDMPRSVAVADLNRDGDLDLAVANQFSDDVSVLLGDGGGGFAALTDLAVGDEPASVTTGDFNRDGIVDLAAANTASGDVSVLLNAVNTAPAATADTYSTDQDVPLQVDAPGVLTNDTDGEGDPLHARLVSGPAHGTLTAERRRLVPRRRPTAASSAPTASPTGPATACSPHHRSP